ncbi:MAG: T9SS type A sorting domain-containing protein [Saprospiraceae bacterium]
MKKWFCFLLFISLWIGNFLAAQEIVQGVNGYISWQKGNLPIVISVPHGGNLTPADIPNRTCFDAVTVTDFNTIQVAQQLNQALFEYTGCYPHIVYCHLKRTKLDCNRNLAEGACANPAASNAWQEFHDFIAMAQDDALQQHGNNIFFIDLHGHGNNIQRIELGYLLYDDELALADALLNTPQYIQYSSIQQLAGNNQTNASHAQLLRGPTALGTLLGNKGYPSVPSQQIPAPGLNTNYFSGGYITANHTCFNDENEVNGVQMELNYTGIRDNANNIQRFADSLALVLTDYILTHFETTSIACHLSVETTTPYGTQEGVFPNPLPPNTTSVQLQQRLTNGSFSLFNSSGKRIFHGTLVNGKASWGSSLPGGLYFLVIYHEEHLKSTVYRIVML